MKKVKIKKKVTIDMVINFFLFIYILSLYFLTQQETLNIISNTIAAILIVLIWVNVLMNNKKLRINNFTVIYAVFLFICMFSVFYAIDGSTAFVKSRTQILNFVLMFSLINYIDSFEKINKALHFFIIAGFLTSVYLILTTDFSNIVRIGSDLGNENAIGTIISLSTIVCVYFILENKIYKLVPIGVTNTVAVLLTGSRQALLFMIMSILFIVILTSQGSRKKKIKYFLLGFFAISLILYLIYRVPIFYEVIGSRIENLLDVLVGEGTTEGSLNLRNYMSKLGIDWFKDRPLLGYGLNNYRYLLNSRMGIFTYSHNNIIELLVGVGILGTSVYYLALLTILKGLLKFSNYKIDEHTNYLFIAVICSYIIMSVSSVYYDNKVFNIVLALSSAYSSIQIKNQILVSKKLGVHYEQNNKSFKKP